MKAQRKETEISEEQYDQILNELYGAIKIGSLTFDPAEVLKKLDPTAYRCGKNDYESALDEDNPIWLCGICETEYDDEEEAEECCSESEKE